MTQNHTTTSTRSKRLTYTSMLSLAAIASILLIPGLAHSELDTLVCSDNDEICKEVVISEDVIEMHETVIYTFSITAVNTDSETWVDVEVKDRLGGDLISDKTPVEDNLECDLGIAQTKSGKDKGGKTEKEFLDCVVADDQSLAPGEDANVSFTAMTDINPGQQKHKDNDRPFKNEYTSCGIHTVNSGATVLYYLESDDQELVEKRSASTAPIYVEVFTVDLAGDCDGDGIIDSEDAFPFDLDNDGIPDVFDEDIDGDGINNDVDQCVYEQETVNGFEDLDGCPDVAP